MASLPSAAELRAANPPLSKFSQLHFLILSSLEAAELRAANPPLSKFPQLNLVNLVKNYLLILSLTAPLRAANPPLSKFVQLH